MAMLLVFSAFFSPKQEGMGECEIGYPKQGMEERAPKLSKQHVHVCVYSVHGNANMKGLF